MFVLTTDPGEKVQQLCHFQKSLFFFFACLINHAIKSNWNGKSIDYKLIDEEKASVARLSVSLLAAKFFQIPNLHSEVLHWIPSNFHQLHPKCQCFYAGSVSPPLPPRLNLLIVTPRLPCHPDVHQTSRILGQETQAAHLCVSVCLNPSTQPRALRLSSF